MKNDVLGKDIKWMCLAGTGDCLFTRFLRPVFVLMADVMRLHAQKEIGSERWGILSLVRVCPCLWYSVDAHHLGRSKCFLYALTRCSVCWWSWYGGLPVFFSCFGSQLVLGL